jgi:hypothetical protein
MYTFLQVKASFPDWPNLLVRFDIWHFMRRFADACSTESHPLYGVFLASLSRCIFEVDASDLRALMDAKKGELAALGASNVSDEDIKRCLTRLEIARHCCRATRGVQRTEAAIVELVKAYESPQGRDILGVPLFPKGALHNVWEMQKKHVKCIQDPPNMESLYYEEPHRIVRGGVSLPVLKCARGSTSLEGFHLHLARFIPGGGF